MARWLEILKKEGILREEDGRLSRTGKEVAVPEKAGDKVTKKRYSFKEEYAISQTPQVVLDHHVRDDLGYLKISWDYIIDIFDKQYITDIFGNV